MRRKETILALMLASVLCRSMTGIPVSVRADTPARPASTELGRPPSTGEIPEGRPALRVFTDKNGLPQNTVTSMAFDAGGRLWIGTQDGAAFYNGRVWTTVNMPDPSVSNNIFSLAASPDGAVWFGTNGDGVARLKDGKWTVLNVKSGSLPGDQVRGLLMATASDGSSTVWVGTANHGLVALRDGKPTVYSTQNSGLPHNRVVCLAEIPEPDGTIALWAGTAGGIGKFHNGRWTTYTTKNSGLPNDGVFCILPVAEADGSTTVWAGTSGGGLARFARGAWTVFSTKSGHLPGDIVRSLAETKAADGSSVLWIGIYGGGVVRYEKGRWTLFNRQNCDLPNDGIWKVLTVPDTPGTVWIGTATGLARLRDNQWTTHVPQNGTPPNTLVMSLLETSAPDGRQALWVGTAGGGLSTLSNGTWTTHATKNSGLPNDRVLSLLGTVEADGRSRVWVGTNGGGLARLENDRWTVWNTTNSELPNNLVWDMAQSLAPDGSRRLWIGTYGGGLARLENDRWTVWNAKNSGLPIDLTMCLSVTRATDGTETVWIGTDGGGLARFENDRWTVYKTENSGIANNAVLSLSVTEASGRQTVWVGTGGGGLSWFDPGAPNPKWTTLSEKTTPALPNGTVNQVCRDRKGRLYVFTNKGVSRLTLDPRTPDDLSRARLYTFTTDDGLPSNECNQGAGLIDRRGRVWAGTVEGVALLDPEREIENRTPKPLNLVWKTAGDPTAMTSGNAPVVLDYTRNTLEFEYALLDYFREEDIRYQTRLRGFDDWSDWKPDGKKEYTGLPAGEYVFEVSARDAGGNLVGPTTTTFRIKPAPWRTWWAYAVYALTGTGLLYGVYEWRILVLRRRQKRRLQHVRELYEKEQSVTRRLQEIDRMKTNFILVMSHEMRTPLTVLRGYGEVLLDEGLGPLNEPQREALDVCYRMTDRLVDDFEEIVEMLKIEDGRLKLKPSEFNLSETVTAAVGDLKRFFKQRRQTVSTDLPERLDITADPEKVRSILTNLLHNAIKFTPDGGRIAVRLSNGDGEARIAVADTGIGIESSELEHVFERFYAGSDPLKHRSGDYEFTARGAGLGLAIAKSYVEAHGGSIWVESAGKDRGSTFHVALPLSGVTEERTIRA